MGGRRLWAAGLALLGIGSASAAGLDRAGWSELGRLARAVAEAPGDRGPAGGALVAWARARGPVLAEICREPYGPESHLEVGPGWSRGMAAAFAAGYVLPRLGLEDAVAWADTVLVARLARLEDLRPVDGGRQAVFDDPVALRGQAPAELVVELPGPRRGWRMPEAPWPFFHGAPGVAPAVPGTRAVLFLVGRQLVGPVMVAPEAGAGGATAPLGLDEVLAWCRAKGDSVGSEAEAGTPPRGEPAPAPPGSSPEPKGFPPRPTPKRRTPGGGGGKLGGTGSDGSGAPQRGGDGATVDPDEGTEPESGAGTTGHHD